MQLAPAAKPLFSHSYSAGSQRRRSDGDYWVADYVAELRLDVLTAPYVLVPDTHLFDGRFFLRHSPRELLELLDPSAQQLPVVVAARQVNGDNSAIASALRASFVANDGSLRSWTRNALADEGSAALSEGLSNSSVDELDAHLGAADSVGRGIEDFLAGLLQAEAGDGGAVRAAGLGEHWDAWIQAEREGLVRTRSYDIARLPLSDEMARDPLEDNTITTVLGRRLRRAVDEVVARGDTAKGSVDRLVGVALDAATSDEELLDVQIIEAWYSAQRARAIAQQHGCWGARGLSSDDSSWPLMAADLDTTLLEILPDDHLVGLPDTFLGDVAAADTETWAAVMHKSTGSRRAWQEDVRRRSQLRATAEVLMGEVSGAAPPEESKPRRYARILAPPVAAGITAYSGSANMSAATATAVVAATVGLVAGPRSSSDRQFDRLNQSVVEFLGFQSR